MYKIKLKAIAFIGLFYSFLCTGSAKVAPSSVQGSNGVCDLLGIGHHTMFRVSAPSLRLC